jgi:beta-galactosidase GanA
LKGLIGGAKKGAKKLSKQQKLHEMRARVQYRTTQFPLQQGVQPVLQQITQGNFITNSIQNMSLEQLQDLDVAAQEVKRSDRISSTVIDHFVPHIQLLKTQREHIDNTIQALGDTFDLVFVDSYCEGQQFLADPFYQEISDRIVVLTTQQQIANAVAGAQAAPAPAQAAPAADAMVEG